MSEAVDSEPIEAAPGRVSPLSFRGRIFKALRLDPTPPLPAWLARLDATLAHSPSLFRGRAVILDLAAFPSDRAALGVVLDELRTRRIRVLGLEGLDQEIALDAGLPPLLINGRPAPDLDWPAGPAKPPLSSVMMEGSVRSGQTVVNLAGDVTVTGSVSSGAEILAGGNIHVYGALRGRAIAGAARNPRARIYCRRFEPELLGIDRLVRTAEEIGPGLRGKPAQVWLDDGAIRIAPLD